MTKNIILGLFMLGSVSVFAQVQTHVIGDSIYMHSNTGTGELILENSTKNVNGFLYNKVNGRTEFRRGLVKLNDSMYVIGNDTLKIPKGVVSGDYIINQSAAAQSSSGFWISGTGRMLNLKTDSYGSIGPENGDAQFGINKTNFVSYSTFYVKQRSSTSFNNPILETYTNTGNQIFSVAGNGILLLNSGGANTGLNLAGGTNSAGIRATPANNSIEEKVIRIHSLVNITKTQAVLNLVQLGSSEGAVPTGRFEPVSGTGSLVNLNVSPYINQTGTASGNVYGVRYNPVDISVQGKSIPFSNTTGSNYFNETSGNTGIGFSPATALSARLHIAAGSSSAGAAPVKLTAGTNLSTPENGAVEFDGTSYFVTSGNTRYTLAKTLLASATLDFASTGAQNTSNLTITVTGAADGDVVSLGVPNVAVNDNSSYSAWVSAANTVTIRFNNFSSGAIDPASGTFRVSVIK